LFGTYFLSLFGSNVLCHRYLLEKARTVIDLVYDEDADPADLLDCLEKSLKWEARSLWLVAVGIPLHYIYRRAALAVLFSGVAVAILMDIVFSVSVTMAFLRPIFRVFQLSPNMSTQSRSYKSMMMTKWMTLVGSSIAVVTSTGLYIDLLLYVTLGGVGKLFWTSPYLNSLVFPVNADSILNDVGMLLVCGVFKKFSWAKLSTKLCSIFTFTGVAKNVS